MTHTSDSAPVADDYLISSTTGLRLHYRDWGGDGRGLLLLHGLASSARIWDLLAPRLRPYGRVVALDQRGHAASAKPDDGYDYTSIVADAQGAAQVLGLTAPVVIGHSWGASVALNYAATDPTCAGVVPIDGGVVDMQANPDATWDNISQRLAPPDLSHLHLDDLVAYMGAGPLGHLDESFRRTFFQALMAEQPDGTIRPRLTRERHLRILRAMWEQRPGPVLDRVTCPILVILAAPPDGGNPEYEALKRDALARFALHPRVETHILPDTIHDIPLQRPERLAELIGLWLGTLGS